MFRRRIPAGRAIGIILPGFMISGVAREPHRDTPAPGQTTLPLGDRFPQPVVEQALAPGRRLLHCQEWCVP